MGLNVHLYPSPIEFESRILRQTAALAGAGWFSGIEVVGTAAPHLPAEERVDAVRTIRRVSIPAVPGPRMLARGLGLELWARRVEALYRGRDISCINAHSLTVLPLAVRLKKATGARLVYDTHELETETATSTPLRQAFSRPTERRLIGLADAVFVVSEGIGEWYRQAYGLDNVTVVLNSPGRAEVAPARAPGAPRPLRDALAVPDEDLVFVYQGVLGRGRAIEPMLAAFRDVPPGRHLAVMGYGPLAGDVRAAADASPTIHLLPPVPPDDVVRWTVGADVGLAIGEHVCLSYELSMPNKLLRYLACGIPALVSDLPEMARLVTNAPGGPLGWVAAPDAAAMRAVVAAISGGEIGDRAARLASWADACSWEAESARMLSVYQHLLTLARR